MKEVMTMARKIKKFGKVINDNPKAMEIYTRQKGLFDQVAVLKKQEDEHFLVYVKMEGMYSLGTVADPWAGQGMRGYDYKYPSQEIRAKERAERDAYYTANVKPLRQKIDELKKQAWALEEPLCIAVCGYGSKEYDLRVKLAQAEKELAQQIAYVERLKKELAEIEKSA
jgi:hypothetical protein